MKNFNEPTETRILTYPLTSESKISFRSEVYNGEKLDTVVCINDNFICVIAGNEIENFHQEIKAIIARYRI